MTTLDHTRLAVRLTDARETFDGAWWPHSRAFATELQYLFAGWPSGSGHISRVFIARADWDDRPTTVVIPGRRGAVKIGLLPADTRDQLVLIMLDGQRHTIAVLPSRATDRVAARLLRAFGAPRDTAAPDPRTAWRPSSEQPSPPSGTELHES